MALRLYELGRRPWEARSEEERKRIAAYEVFCARGAAIAEEQEALLRLKKS